MEEVAVEEIIEDAVASEISVLEERNHCIYMITSPSGKSYIGQTNNYDRRMSEHKGGYCKKSLVWVFVNKYGWDNLTKEILHKNLTLAEANLLEAEEILTRNTITPNGYNLREGGDKFTTSDETKAKISTSLKGRKMSPEWVEKLKVRMKGKKFSPLAISKRAEKMIGYTHSEETRAKMSISQKNRPPAIEEYIEACRLRYDGRFQTPENIAKSATARTGVPQHPEWAAKSRVASLGTKRTDEFKIAQSERFKSRELTDEWIEKMTISNKNNQLFKEFPIYSNNINMFEEGSVLRTGDVCKMIGVTKMTVIKRIKNKDYPNAYVGSGFQGRQPWLIPIQDIHDYYNQ